MNPNISLITEPVQPIKHKVSHVQLKLTSEQAIFIKSILRHIGGAPNQTARIYERELHDLFNLVHVPHIEFSKQNGGIDCTITDLINIQKTNETWRI